MSHACFNTLMFPFFTKKEKIKATISNLTLIYEESGIKKAKANTNHQNNFERPGMCNTCNYIL